MAMPERMEESQRLRVKNKESVVLIDKNWRERKSKSQSSKQDALDIKRKRRRGWHQSRSGQAYLASRLSRRSRNRT